MHGPSGDTAAIGDIIRQIGPAALPDLLAAAAGNQNAQTRRKAVAALGYSGADALPHVLRLMSDPNPQIRDAAIRSVGAVGPAAKEALPALVKIVREENVNFRTAAISSLGKLGPEAKPAVPLLLECLKDKDPNVRITAITALGLVPLDAKTALPVLDEAIKDDKATYLRFAAVQLRLKLDADPGSR